MTKKIIGSCIASIALMMGTAQAQVKVRLFDNMMYTINPKITPQGPIFKDADTAGRTRYGNSVISIILKEADQKARKYLEAGDNQAYYAFMALGLTVPLHEGLYVHFRNSEGSPCTVDANSGELVKKAGDLTYKLFNDAFKSGATPYFPNCETMPQNVGLNQMIRGGDGTDLSMMQVSIRWHFDDFLANKKFESVQGTLNYGMSHLLAGFDPVYRNVQSYKCISEPAVGFAKRKMSYINLAKGIWAGKYNSGSIAQTCRFADPASPYAKNDQNFARNFDKILNFNGTISPDYIGEMVIDGNVASAIREIVSNLKENKNNRASLEKVLNQ